MNKPAQHVSTTPVDKIQQRLTTYTCVLKYDDIPAEAVRAAKMRIIDTLGALMGGFHDEPSRIARDVVAELAVPAGSTVIGTNMKTTPDLAAFANATTARSVEGNDVAHKAGGRNGHPSDVVMPLLAVAENSRVSGREFITAIVLAGSVSNARFRNYHE